MNTLAVQCSGIRRVYEQGEIKVYALNGVDITIKRGEFLSLFGPSGSGKTTLLNIIGGLDTPTSGTINVNGTELASLSKSKLAAFRLHSLGFIFQAYNLIPVLSAQENVEFVMQLQGVSARERAERARAVLSDVGLGSLESRRPNELSGGQQQRVAVARAIVSEPALILADEPTANLDSSTSENLLELMKQMNEKRNITFLFSTHDHMVMDYASRLVELKDGHVISDHNK